LASLGFPILASIRLDVLERLAVDSRCAAVGFASGISEAQNISTVHLVVQKIEPILRVLPSMRSAASGHLMEFRGCPISLLHHFPHRLERGLLSSAGIARLPRYYEPIRLPAAPGLTFAGLWLVSRLRPRDG